LALIGAIVAAGIVVGIDGTRKAPAEPAFPWEPPQATAAPDAPSVGQEDAT
jgi:hypothetical protein